MKSLLIIASSRIDNQPILTLFKEIEIDDIAIREVASFGDAEEVLFEGPIALIIVDWELEGAYGFISALKGDEMFRLLPVCALLPAGDSEMIKQAYLSGADNYISRDRCGELLAYTIRPLIINNVLNSELVQKISELQEQAIHDFILQDIIKKYVSLSLYRKADIYAYEQKILIQEEELELTIVFADIKDFTRTSQHLMPGQVIKNLNDVFEIVTKIIYENNGDIDKFIGDAFFAVFVSPADAVRSSVLIQKELETLNAARKENGLPQVLLRIGMYTGPVIRGNVGGHNRFDNTLIGDTVNAASRLEQICIPGEILISTRTLEAAGLSVPEDKQLKTKLRGRDREEVLYYIFESLKEGTV